MEKDKETLYLVRKFQEAEAQNDNQGRDVYFGKLLVKYNDLIYRIVRDFPIPPSVGVDDVVAVAKAGLWKGFKRYNPELSRVTTYMTRTIKGEIKRYYRDYCWRWKVPRRLKEAISSSPQADVKSISAKFGIAEEEVIEIQNILKSHVSHEDYHDLRKSIGPAEEVQHDMFIEQMLSSLNDDEREIVELYYLNGRQLIDIADICCTDIVAVKKLLASGLDKLQMNFRGLGELFDEREDN